MVAPNRLRARVFGIIINNVLTDLLVAVTGSKTTTTKLPHYSHEILITDNGQPVEGANVRAECGDLPLILHAVEQANGKYRLEDDFSHGESHECKLIVELDG